MAKRISSKGIRKALIFATTALAGLAASVAPSFAQTAEDDEPIIVTGSRIARDPNLTAPAPVQTIGQEAITQGGVFNTADVLADIPALQFSTTTEQSLAGNFGQNTLNLRGMGEARTLTLVNGRRFVSGVEGTQSVDVGSIPQALIERVEVMTGGASAVYGADAVTGVVNFVLREDFEGFDLNLRGGLSGEEDAGELSASAVWGRNFAHGRGNITMSLAYHRGEALTVGDRSWAGDANISGGAENPALRFQRGEINATDTPNLAQWYDLSNGYFPWGLLIPDQSAFVTEYTALFGAPTLTPAEIALFNRAAGATPLAILPGANFSITSTAGVISGGPVGTFTNLFNGIDLNSNGTDDCAESFVGFNSTFMGGPDVFGLGPFGFNSYGDLGGCWVAGAAGPRVYTDGLVAGDFNHYGGDGFGGTSDGLHLLPEEERTTFSIAGNLEIAPNVRLFGELLYSYHKVDYRNPYNTFWDLLYGAPDNPFLPTALQPLAAITGELRITRDMIDLGPNLNTNERRTFRFVGGAEGTMENGWAWEFTVNYGEFAQRTIDRNYVIMDRFFAAIDAVDIGGGPECRSNTDLTPPPATPFSIPRWDDPGFYTFTPGDGQCQPADIWNGIGGISQAAIDFITTTVVDRQTITQFVMTYNLVGDTRGFFSLPAGPIDWAIGAEYRRETSRFQSNPWDRGILPAGSPFGEGTYVGDISLNPSLGFNGGSIVVVDSSGEYDVYDFYGEASIPLLRDQPFARELTLDAAFRYSDYSSVGSTETWRLASVWAPMDDLRLRVSQSQSVRAPNINELYSPITPAFFRPTDPCGIAQRNALSAADPAAGAIREANCSAALGALGMTPAQIAAFTGILSARFPGSTRGNPDLQEETADTLTYGFVLQPSFLPGLSISIDYWDIRLEDPINLVGQQDVVDNCYDSPTFPNFYCDQLVRSGTAGPTLGLLTEMNLQYVNLAAIEAEGIDLMASYAFSLGPHDFTIALQATQQRKLDFFIDPLDLSAVDPELGEIGRPEYTANLSIGYGVGPVRLGWRTQYIGEQLLGGGGIVQGPEIETYMSLYGAAAEGDAIYLHDFSFRVDIGDRGVLFGGVNNVTDELPYRTETAYPTSARGRFFYAGVSARW